MLKTNGKAPQNEDPRLHLEGLSAYGLEEETREQAILGGLLGRNDDSTVYFVAVLFATDMPKRFKALEVGPEGAFLVRTDDLRCEIMCDPLEAENAAEKGRIMIMECPSNNSRNNELAYEIDAYALPAPGMRM